MTTVTTLLVITMLAFLVESLVEYAAGKPFDMIPVLTPYKWALAYLAMVVGVVGALVYKFDLLFILAKSLGVPLEQTTFGIIITGMAIGRGSSFIHDLTSKYFSPKPGTTP